MPKMFGERFSIPLRGAVLVFSKEVATLCSFVHSELPRCEATNPNNSTRKSSVLRMSARLGGCISPGSDHASSRESADQLTVREQKLHFGKCRRMDLLVCRGERTKSADT